MCSGCGGGGYIGNQILIYVTGERDTTPFPARPSLIIRAKVKSRNDMLYATMASGWNSKGSPNSYESGEPSEATHLPPATYMTPEPPPSSTHLPEGDYKDRSGRKLQ